MQRHSRNLQSALQTRRPVGGSRYVLKGVEPLSARVIFWSVGLFAAVFALVVVLAR